jgi:hypothetical protein
MAKGDILSVTLRTLTAEEIRLTEWFEKQEASAAGNLEKGGRQIIGLVTALYGVLFGVLALGQEKFEASLGAPAAQILGAAAVILLLLALVAALVVVLPFGYRYRQASLSDRKRIYGEIIARKSTGLTVAAVLFCLGLATFAGLIAVMLLAR